VLESILRWFEKGIADIGAGLRGAKREIDKFGDQAVGVGRNVGERAAQVGKGAADATKSAVDAVIKLPSTRVVEGRERCVASGEGAPDCQAAANALCRSRGFSGGRSVDFVSAEKCPPAVWLNRRPPAPGECVTEMFVTRALCQ